MESFRFINDAPLIELFFGKGFGQDNFINPFKFGQENYNLHNTYLELLINCGLFIYICFMLVLFILKVNFILFIERCLIYSPVLLSIVSISSAVYYPQFYLLMAALVFYSKSKDFSCD